MIDIIHIYNNTSNKLEYKNNIYIINTFYKCINKFVILSKKYNITDIITIAVTDSNGENIEINKNSSINIFYDNKTFYIMNIF